MPDGQQGGIKARPGMLGALMLAQADRYDWTRRPKNRCFSKWKQEDGPKDPKHKEILCNFLGIRWVIYQVQAWFRRHDFYRTVPPNLLPWYKVKNWLLLSAGLLSVVAMVLSILATQGRAWTVVKDQKTEFLSPYYPVTLEFGFYESCRVYDESRHNASADMRPADVTANMVAGDLH
eukprot:g5567.t1